MKTNIIYRTNKEKLKKYEDREAKIKELKLELIRLENEHHRLTMDDFGIANGEVVTIKKMVCFFEKLMGSK